MAFSRNRIYVGTPDAHVICLDARHGKQIWDVTTADVSSGEPRKLLAQTSRNGFCFVLDRVTGNQCYVEGTHCHEWASGVDSEGQPISRPEKEPKVDGSLLHTVHIGGTSWMASSLDPQTGLFYVSALEGYSFWYLVLDQEGMPEDHQGGGSVPMTSKSSLLALDVMTDEVHSQREEGNGSSTPGIHHRWTSAVYGRHRRQPACHWTPRTARYCGTRVPAATGTALR